MGDPPSELWASSGWVCTSWIFPPERSSGPRLRFCFAFAVKVPVFPLHGWLADTYGEAPVALAMVVAGKLGLYSMLRFT